MLQSVTRTRTTAMGPDLGNRKRMLRSHFGRTARRDLIAVAGQFSTGKIATGGYTQNVPNTKAMIDDIQIPDDPYAEGTPLTWAFGETPKALLMAALLSERDRAIRVVDLSRMTGLTPDKVHTHIDHLQTRDLVVQTKTSDGEWAYQINSGHEAAKELAELEEALLEEWYQSSAQDY